MVKAKILSRATFDTTPTVTLPDFALYDSWNCFPTRWFFFCKRHPRDIYLNRLRILFHLIRSYFRKGE